VKIKKTIGLVGNPNCGKTTVFNAMTGGKQHVGNWPGVTVEKKEGAYVHKNLQIHVVDLPGIYSLSSSSLDEEVARNYIVDEHPDLLVNIVDASNLERNLYLTIQLIEMRVPIVLVLNMTDILKQKNMKIKIDELSRMLDVPIVTTVANRKEGFAELKDAIDQSFSSPHISKAHIYFPDELESAIHRLLQSEHLKNMAQDNDERWFAVKLLENDIAVPDQHEYAFLKKDIDHARKEAEAILGEETDILIAEGRYGFINSVCKKVLDRTNIIRRDISDAIDEVVLNRLMGIPIFFIAMYFVFWITINFGGCFIDFFDIFFGAVCVDALSHVLHLVHVPAFLVTFLADGIGGGIQTIATFIPPIFFMFFSLAILEDSGYMARAAFVMDRVMRAIGLPGKAFVPMLVGFGCNVPAIMATRTLENEKDRIMTIMMNPFMSCGARMPVYALFAAAFFPRTGDLIVFVLYLTGILLAILTAFLMKKTLLKGEASMFIMELPPYHIPTVKGIFIHTWERLKAFLFRAGKAILLVVVILTFFNSLGIDGSFGNQNTDRSVLSIVGKKIVPVFKPMGMREDNWPAAVGIFTGIFAKEAVIGTLDSLYSQMDDRVIAAAETEEEVFDFKAAIKDSFKSIPANFANLRLPFTFSGLIGADVGDAIAGLEIDDTSYQQMKARFDGKVGAFAYLLMILLYMPCVAAIAAVYRELNLKWTVFIAAYLSGLAWICSTLFYQFMRYSAHPFRSGLWISICSGVLIVFVVIVKKRGRKLSQI
jgi:ferrous iron transport protein B